MDQETFNLGIRKFLKMVGGELARRRSSRRSARPWKAGGLRATETLKARVMLELPEVGLKLPFDGEIKLK